jgi:uncharacterized membrane protein (Fun14 family)
LDSQSWLLPYLGTGIGFGLVTGWAVGFVTKKVAKIAAFFLGVLFIAVQVLVVNKLLVVNWHGFTDVFIQVTKPFTSNPSHWWSLLLVSFPYAGAFAVGFAFGFKKG